MFFEMKQVFYVKLLRAKQNLSSWCEKRSSLVMNWTIYCGFHEGSGRLWVDHASPLQDCNVKIPPKNQQLKMSCTDTQARLLCVWPTTQFLRFVGCFYKLAKEGNLLSALSAHDGKIGTHPFLPTITSFMDALQRQTGLSVSYRNYRYQGSWYQYRSRSRNFWSLGISIGIDPEPWAFFGRSWQNSY